MGIGAAVLGAAAVGAAGSVASGLIGSGAAKSASDAQVAQDQNALAVQQQDAGQAVAAQQQASADALAIQQQNTTLATQAANKANRVATAAQVGGENAASSTLAPYADIGVGAAHSLANLYGIGYAAQPGAAGGTAANGVVTPPSLNAGVSSPGGSQVQQAAQLAFTQSPDYNFAFTQGLKALDMSAAASGTLQSGGQTQAAIGFGQGLASQQYGNYFSRLSGLAGMGQSASTSLAGVQQTGGNNLASTALTTGQTLAGAYTNAGNTQANNLLSTGSGVANTLNQTGNAQAATLQGAGTAQASGIVGSANALTGGINGIGSSVFNSLLLSKLGGQSPSAYTDPTAGYNNSTSNYLGLPNSGQDALQDSGYPLP